MQGYFRRRGCTCEEGKKCTCGAKWSFTLDMGRDSITNRRIQKTKSGFKSKKEADLACAELIAQIKNNNYKEPNKIPFKLFLDEWLAYKKMTIKQITYDKYNMLISKHISPYLGNLQLSKIAPLNITSFYTHLKDEKKLKNSIADIHGLLYNILDQAFKWDYIQKNIMSLVDKPSTNKKEIEVWSKKESRLFLQEAKSSRHYIAFLLALTTGMRQGEILGLRWKDIDFEKGTITIVQTLSHDGKVIQSHTKTANSVRSISIDRQTLRELASHKKGILEEKLKVLLAYENNDLVICTTMGSPIGPRNLIRTFFDKIEKAKIKKIRFHDLRHTHATLLLQQGVNPKIVAERLGHADVRTTLDTYSHLLPNMQKDTANQFGAMFFDVK